MVEQSAVNRLVVGSSPTWGVVKTKEYMENNSDKLIIGDKSFTSRLMLGTGKYKTTKDGIDSINSSGCEIVTVAIRRLPTNLKHDTTNFLNQLDWNKHWLPHQFYYLHYQVIPNQVRVTILQKMLVLLTID